MKQPENNSPAQWSVAELGAFFIDNRSEFLAHANRVARSSSNAEEIVQDSLVRVLLACPELESTEHARSYFHKVIENLGVDQYRREGRQPKLVILDEAMVEVEAKWVFEPDLVDGLVAADDAAIVREAIALLSPAERAALIMWEFEGRTVAEISRDLGIKESAVRHTVARARARLRRILAERIVDQQRGLTALDLLSFTYRRAEEFGRKSSKVALSLILVVSAFFGFSSLSPEDFSAPNPSVWSELSIQDDELALNAPESQELVKDADSKSRTSSELMSRTGDAKNQGAQLSASFATTSGLMFAGLDTDGMPMGFTVADSLGNLGILFPGQSRLSATETGLLLSGIVSTKSGAVNVLIDQSIIVDAFGTSYLGEVSVGINGGWQPLSLSYISSDVERLASGNYLLTAIMMVDSALETVIKVSTGTSGTDLSSAPVFISTRVMLDPTKTKILAQAVFVSADSQGDGA